MVMNAVKSTTMSASRPSLRAMDNGIMLGTCPSTVGACERASPEHGTQCNIHTRVPWDTCAFQYAKNP